MQPARSHPIEAPRQRLASGFTSGLASLCLLMSACTPAPLQPFTTEGVPLVLLPAASAGIRDQRARFREIFCAVLETRGSALADYRPCEDALTRLGAEPAATQRPVALGASRRQLVAAVVPGIGYECFEPWLQPPGSVQDHLQRFGYGLTLLKVEALSGSARNARLIRDAVMAMPADPGAPRLVLLGYSKGAPDIMEAVVAYPEMRSRVAAVVSVAGAVGGSALANDATQDQADLMRHFPGARCDGGDGGAVDSLRPATRQAWLAHNALPPELHYYSLVTLPQPERVSLILRRSRDKLARIDGRNDSQVLFHDQLLPRSTLMGYLNADHWAVALPINRTRAGAAAIAVTQNDFPREALMEALLRFVEEDLADPGAKGR